MPVGKYVKRAFEVEALQWIDNEEEMAQFLGELFCLVDIDDKLIIDTLEGQMKASLGDYIIKGIEGEYYPCRQDIFEKTYDKVE